MRLDQTHPTPFPTLWIIERFTKFENGTRSDLIIYLLSD